MLIPDASRDLVEPSYQGKAIFHVGDVAGCNYFNNLRAVAYSLRLTGFDVVCFRIVQGLQSKWP